MWGEKAQPASLTLLSGIFCLVLMYTKVVFTPELFGQLEMNLGALSCIVRYSWAGVKLWCGPKQANSGPLEN